MATFDPYHIWLGIPSEDQPPSDYRFLAIPELESDPEVIHKAAAQQTIYLQMFQSGEHADLAEQLLKEISAARDSVLNRELKNKYGLQLKPEKSPVPLRSKTSDGQQPPASLLPSYLLACNPCQQRNTPFTIHGTGS